MWAHAIEPLIALVECERIYSELSFLNSSWMRKDAIKERYPGITLYPDASGSSRKTSAPKTDHMILRDAKFKVHSPSKNPPVKDRVNAVNNMLRNRRITISKKCKHLIKDLEQLGWKNGDVDKSNIKLTHASDAAGYAISYLFPVKVERDFTKPQPRAWRP